MSSEPVLLPVWIMAYRYRDEVFRFLVNGQTGKCSGQAPVSQMKIAVVVGAVLLVIALALMLLFCFGVTHSANRDGEVAPAAHCRRDARTTIPLRTSGETPAPQSLVLVDLMLRPTGEDLLFAPVGHITEAFALDKRRERLFVRPLAGD
jgi:hypothetical protein